jgi:hypothetical protein
MTLSLLYQVRDMVERAWQKAQFNHDVFADIAEAALIEADFPRSFRLDWDELTRWILQRGNVHAQNGRPTFSDLPFAIAHGNGGFYVELLTWTNSTSSIHQHSFSGAFTVGHGSSIHSTFNIETLERVTENLQLVRGSLVNSERLEPGLVRRIEPAHKLSHSVFHLDEPTISIVVRTNNEPWHMPQLSLLPPSYTYSPAWAMRDGQIEHLIRTFTLMHKVSAPNLLQIACDRFADLDFVRALHLFVETRSLWYGPPLDAILARFKAAHGRLAEPLPKVIERFDFEGRIRRIRVIETDPHERFALAVLSVAHSRAQAREVLKQHPRGEALIHESTIPAMRKFWDELGD